MALATADSIIMTKIVESISKSEGTSHIFKSLIPIMPGIVVMVFVSKCLVNAGEIFRGIVDAGKYLLSKIFYRDEFITNIDVKGGREKFLSSAYYKRSVLTSRNFLPIYWTRPDDVGYLSYLPIYHSNLISECHQEAEEAYNDYHKSKGKKTEYRKFSKLAEKMGYMKSSPSTLYPSKNYLRLGKIITSHFEVSELVGVYSAIGVLIDGIQGLGKTKFADFAADQGFAGAVNKIDMTSFLNSDFKTIIEKFYHHVDIEENTIFMIDDAQARHHKHTPNGVSS